MKKIFVFFCLLFLSVPLVHAESLDLPKTSTQVPATITEIQSVRPVTAGMNAYEFRAQTKTGEVYNVHTSDSAPEGIAISLKKGQKIFLQKIDGNPPQVYFEDVERTGALWWILSLFVLLSLVVGLDRKSTRLNSSHSSISYAAFCLKKMSIRGYRGRAFLMEGEACTVPAPALVA